MQMMMISVIIVITQKTIGKPEQYIPRKSV